MWFIVLAAFTLRLGALLATSGIAPLYDEKNYLLRAEKLLNGDGFVGSYQSWVRHGDSPFLADLPQYTGSYQPPVYPVFIAGVYALTNHSVFAVKLVQVLLGTVTVALVYWLALRWFCRRTALIAAGYCAIYPNLIAFTHYLWTETLFVFLVTFAFALLTTTDTLPSKRRCIGSGILLGLAALTKATILYFTPVLFVWLVLVYRGQRKPACKRVALATLVMFVTLSPWVVRNYFVHGTIVLTDTNGAYNVWRGNAGKHIYFNRPQPPEYSYAPPFESIPLMAVRANREPELVRLAKKKHKTARPTDIQVAETAKTEAIKNITNDPKYFVLAAWYKMIDMWNPTSFLVRHFRFGRYGVVRPSVQQAIQWAAILTYCLAILFAVPGALLCLTNPRVWLILLMVGFFCSVHAFAFGLTRFRLPLMPFIIMLSAAGVVRALALFKGDDSAGDEEIVICEGGTEN